MMMNFLVAVIEISYKEVDVKRNIHIYKNKAELNCDYYQIVKYFRPNKSFRTLVFTSELQVSSGCEEEILMNMPI